MIDIVPDQKSAGNNLTYKKSETIEKKKADKIWKWKFTVKDFLRQLQRIESDKWLNILK